MPFFQRERVTKMLKQYLSHNNFNRLSRVAIIIQLVSLPCFSQQDLSYERRISLLFTANKQIKTQKYRLPIESVSFASPDAISISLFGQWTSSAWGRAYNSLSTSNDLASINNSLSTEEQIESAIPQFYFMVGSMVLASIMSMDNVQWRTYAITAPVAGQYHFTARLKGQWAVKPANIVKLFSPTGACLLNETVVLGSDTTKHYYLNLTAGTHIFQVGLGSGSSYFATAGTLDDALLDDTQQRTWLIPTCLTQEFNILNFPDTLPAIGGSYHFEVPYTPMSDSRQLDPNGAITYTNIVAHPPKLNEFDTATRYEVIDPPLDGGPTAAGSYTIETIQSDATISGFTWNGSICGFNVLRNPNQTIGIEVVRTSVAP